MVCDSFWSWCDFSIIIRFWDGFAGILNSSFCLKGISTIWGKGWMCEIHTCHPITYTGRKGSSEVAFFQIRKSPHIYISIISLLELRWHHVFICWLKTEVFTWCDSNCEYIVWCLNHLRMLRWCLLTECLKSALITEHISHWTQLLRNICMKRNSSKHKNSSWVFLWLPWVSGLNMESVMCSRKYQIDSWECGPGSNGSKVHCSRQSLMGIIC